MGSCQSSRGLFGGGYNPSHTDDIDLVTIMSTGNSTDFGNLTLARAFCGGVSSPHSWCMLLVVECHQQNLMY